MEMPHAASTVDERFYCLRKAKGVATVFVTLPTLSKLYIAVRNEWFLDYFDPNLTNRLYCYIGEEANDLCFRKLTTRV